MRLIKWNVRANLIVKKNGRTGLYKRKFLREILIDESKDGLNAIMTLYERMRTLKEIDNETIISVVDFECFNTSKESSL